MTEQRARDSLPEGIYDTLPQEGFPHYINNRFSIISKDAAEKDYYAAYNILLNEYFPAREGYSVAPVAQPVGERDSIEITIEYIVECNAKPIMFLEIKPPRGFEKISMRKVADEQMRKRYTQLLDEIPEFIHKFYGLSAFGTRIAYYVLDKREMKIMPKKIQDDDTFITDTAPKERWDSDIMQNEGALRFIEMAERIKHDLGHF